MTRLSRSSNPPTQPDSRSSLMIGIDLGTTYSSVGYLVVNYASACSDLKAGKCDIISSLQPVPFNHGEQVKTQLAWDGVRQQFKWGDGVSVAIRNGDIPESGRIGLFKLGLDDSAHLNGVHERLNYQISQLPPEAKVETADDLICIFLKFLYDYCQEKLYSTFLKTRGDIFQLFKIESILCVPAMWIHRINVRMKAIALRAGIESLEIVSEPEAAAVYFQYDTKRKNPMSDKLAGFDEPFLVLDIGGGTADIVTYLSENGCISQATRGVGGIHGSSRLNTYFGEVFTDHIAPDKESIIEGWMSDYCCTSVDDTWRDILNQVEQGFEMAKRDFEATSETSPDSLVRVEVKGFHRRHPNVGIELGCVRLPRSQVEDLVFARLIDPILALVHDEMAHFKATYQDQGLKIKHVFVVGGTSRNDYIYRVLEQQLPSVSRPLPGQSATLVAMGSILQALQRSAKREKVIRYSLGFAWHEEYNPDIHTEAWDPNVHGKRMVEKDPFEGHDIVRKRIKWLYRVNQNVVPGSNPRTMTGYQGLYADNKMYIKERIYISETETRDHLPVKGSDNIRCIGFVELNLATRDTKDFPKTSEVMWNQEGYWRRMDYRMRITYDEPHMKYEILVPRKGRATSESDWDDNPICEEVELQSEDLFDKTKQRPQLSPEEQAEAERKWRVRQIRLNAGMLDASSAPRRSGTPRRGVSNPATPASTPSRPSTSAPTVPTMSSMSSQPKPTKRPRNGISAQMDGSFAECHENLDDGKARQRNDHDKDKLSSTVVSDKFSREAQNVGASMYDKVKRRR